MEFNSEDIDFPVTMTMKIIAIDVADMPDRLNTCLAGLGIEHKVHPGNHSAKGTYVTYNVEATFKDLESLRGTFDAVSAVDGVKMVL